MTTSFKSLLLVAAFGAFATTSCSQKTQDNAAATADSAAADAKDNANSAADATKNAADNTANAVDNAADKAKANMGTDKGDTAVVRNKEANKMVEETPKKK